MKFKGINLEEIPTASYSLIALSKLILRSHCGGGPAEQPHVRTRLLCLSFLAAAAGNIGRLETGVWFGTGHLAHQMMLGFALSKRTAEPAGYMWPN